MVLPVHRLKSFDMPVLDIAYYLVHCRSQMSEGPARKKVYAYYRFVMPAHQAGNRIVTYICK
jgi:hypothetical protein